MSGGSLIRKIQEIPIKKSPQLRVFLFACLVAATVSSSGCSWLLGNISGSPPVGQPIVCDDHVVFNSPTDSKTLTCIDLQGSIIWERKYPTDIRYSRRNDSSVAVQAGMNISVVDVPTGKETPLFKIRTEHERVRFDHNGTVLYVEDNCDEHWNFRMLDPESGAILWERADMGYAILALEDVVICLTLDNGVEAFDSKSGKRVWKTPLSEDEDFPRHFMVLLPVHSDTHIVISDLFKLICLRTDNGQIVSTIDLPEDYGNIGPVVSSKDGLLVYAKTEGHFDKPPPGGFRTILRLYSLPDLKEESVSELSTVAPIAGIMYYDQYIIAVIAHSNFPTACFDATTKQKLWEKQMHGKSQPVNKKIYFSNFGNWKDIPFRIGVIDIPSGNEIILYEEDISDDDSGS